MILWGNWPQGSKLLFCNTRAPFHVFQQYQNLSQIGYTLGTKCYPRWNPMKIELQTPQDAPKTPLDAPKTPPRRPKTVKDAPKTAPRWPQDGPKTPPRHPQDTPRRPKTPADAPKPSKTTPRRRFWGDLWRFEVFLKPC